MTKKLRDMVVGANVRRFRNEQAVDEFPGNMADNPRLTALMRELRAVRDALTTLRRDLRGAAESGSTPQALFEDRLLAGLGLVRGQCYPEEEITRRLKRVGVTDATERLAAKIELEQMGMIEGHIRQSSKELKAQALGLLSRPLSGLARYGIDDSGARTYREPELDALLQPWNLDPTVRIGLKAEASARGLLRG
jgi:hypothetical protein